jgi:hypothetical protein
MSFRLEEKIPVTPSDANLMLKELYANGLQILFPDREITSIYFDNQFLQMFTDSEEGLLPRKKIRIREYNFNSSQILLEKKISSIEGRYKQSTDLSLNDKSRLIKLGYYDDRYGITTPKVVVSYKRSYFLFQGSRITFDRKINYVGFKDKKTFFESYNVFEIKDSINKMPDDLFKIIPSQKKRFSKFSNAVQAILG